MHDRRFRTLFVALSAACAGLWGTTTVARAQTSFEPGLYSALEWTNVGPERGGRSIGVAGSPDRPYEYYFGATGGGLWKTTDGGQSWSPVTDGKINSSSVGAVAVCEANPDIVYIGTGETQLRGNIMQGDGAYRSNDAGKTWTHIGLEAGQNIARLRVHPTNCDEAYAAVFGRIAGPNAERGIYKTTDGGQTWRRVLHRDDRSGGVDLVIDRTNPQVVYAALWEAFRKTWGLSSGGSGSGLFRSTDGGATWTELTKNPGLPAGTIGKIGVAVSGADPNRVYAIIEADEGGVFRSDDGGATWERTNDERKLRQRAFYYTRIYADPVEKDRVYVLNTGFYRSDDAGKTFETSIRVPHGDNHDLWIAPNDNQRMINSNDGGANVSVNGGRTWTEQDYPTAQMYRVSTTDHEPYFVCGGQQDNSTACVPSKGWDHLAARGPNHGYYFAVGGCESGYAVNDPKDPNIFYSGCYGGSLDRYDHRTGQTRAVNVWPENPMGHSAEDIRERVQWTFPIVFSPVDPNILYTGSQHLWKTMNEGQTWEKISPDLTRADPATMGPSGGPITKDQTGVETYATIFAIAPSPHDVNEIWSGSDDGYVQLTRDGGRTWANVTPRDLPPHSKISTVELSPHSPGKAYVAAHRYLADDRAPYVYRTSDYGRSWTKIVGGIAPEHFARSIREDIKRPGLLYLGTEHGAMVSWDDGASWHSLSQNLPDVQVSDLAVTENDLAISTHGRSFYIMFGIQPLRELTPAVAAADVHLFRPIDPVRGIDRGVDVYYNLKSDAAKVTIEFLDAAGKVIRSFEGTAEEMKAAADETPSFFGPAQREHPPTKAGMNRFSWDLRHPGYTAFEGMIFWAARNAGPVALPGRYQVRLTADGRSQTQSFEIRLDPRVQGVTLADLQARFDFAMKIRDRVNDANQAVTEIRAIRTQVDDRLSKTQDRQATSLASALTSRLSGVEQEVYQVRNRSNQDPLNFPIKLNNKLAALLGHVESAESRPTDVSFVVFEELSGRLEQQLVLMNRIIDEDLSRLNDRLRQLRLDPIQRRPTPPQDITED